MKCEYCGRNRGWPCKNTRDMEEIGDGVCDNALMRLGGGERTVNRLRAQRLAREGAGPFYDNIPE